VLHSAALGKEKYTVNSSFAECQTLDKEKHSAKNFLPSVEHSAKVDVTLGIRIINTLNSSIKCACLIDHVYVCSNLNAKEKRTFM
jgi:hypothetical protein